MLLFIASVVFTGLNVSYMRKCELTYYKTTAVVTKMSTRHDYVGNGAYHNQLQYTFTYMYMTEDGAQREVQGHRTIGIEKFDPNRVYVGETVEIYVDTDKNEAVPVEGADLYSVISVVFFVFAAITYVVGSALLLHEKRCGLKHRLLITWLPLAVICIASVLLFWAGLPNGAFVEIFTRVGGAIGYAVIGGLVCIAAATDSAISKKMREKV